MSVAVWLNEHIDLDDLAALEISRSSADIVKSKRYSLVPNQEFLAIPANFERGQIIEINVLVQPNSDGQKFSVEGTPLDLPELETSSGR